MTRQHWPSHHLSVQEVRTWISSAAPGHPAVAGPKRILRGKDWGVTAVFTTDPAAFPEREVIFNACCLPIFQDAPRIAALLHRLCSGHVPEPLAWRQDRQQTWTLYRPFRGAPIVTGGVVEALVDVARTIAQIQVAVSAHPSELRDLSRLAVREIPTLLDDVIAYASEKYLRHWAGWKGPRAELMPGFPRVLERARQVRPCAERWADELAAGAWPYCVDHPDLHENNAVIEQRGRILIFDWEEASVTMPFFALDELLVTAQVHGAVAVEGVRKAYLGALPWGTAAERQRALNLAMLLLPIKKAHEYYRLSLAMGRDEGNPHLAFVLTDGVRRWDAAMRSGLAP